MKRLISALLAFACLTTMTSCLYRSPEADEVSTNPTTNNPQIKGKGNDDGDFIPGISY